MGRSMRPPSTLRRLLLASLAVAAVVLFTGFDMDGPQSTIHVEGPVAQKQLNLFYVTLVVTTFIFVTVGGTLLYAQIRFRARKTDDDSDPPPQTHGHPLVEIGLIVGSIVLLVFIAIPTVDAIVYTEETPDRENALTVRVTGYQWWFKFEYPELTGAVFRPQKTANEMVIPTNRPIHIELRTIDVIHSFWVPKLAGKVDLVPNRGNHMWLQADRANYYWAQCAEFCGESHANMRFRVVSLDEPDFNAWVERQHAEARNVTAQATTGATPGAAAPTPVASMADAESPFAYWQSKQVLPPTESENAELIARGRQLFAEKSCVVCHTIRGHGAPGITGPDLTHFGSRTTIAAALLDNTPENLRRWLEDPNGVKPGNLMWRDGFAKLNIQLTDADLDALVAYLDSLK